MVSSKVRVWSIQTIPVLEELNSNGIYRPDPKKITRWVPEIPEEKDPYYHSYLWMVAEMEKRIPPKPFKGAMPIWGWHQWLGITQPKPDLRSGGHLPPGTRGVRFELDLDPSRVLISDFDLWFFPFSGIYLGKNNGEDEEFRKLKEKAGLDYNYGDNLDLPDHLMRILHKSWERVFDLSFYRPGYNDGKNKKALQATFWEIRQEDVRKAQEFTAR